MASKPINLKFDFNGWFQSLAEQFRGLDPKEPGQWPLAPKIAAGIVVAILAVVAGWFLLLSDEETSLQTEQDREPALKADFTAKLAQAVNLPELRKQKSQVEEYVTQLEKQLPGKAEMDALLSDINQAGLGRGLQFELFRPGQLVAKDYYAELPISIRVTGRYHDIGAFTADVSNLSRIVTLHNLLVNAANSKDVGSGNLVMEATARTYRYLDPGEVAEQKKAAAAAKGAKK
ncbi:MAG TPA: type 4a pilus biogenesis protein PilO [Burkholderiaceae bacterium]|jgi:type IV pilus assembly protein PilO